MGENFAPSQNLCATIRVNQSAGNELLSLHGYLVHDIPPIPATGLDQLRGFQGGVMRPPAQAPTRKKR
jgi:hypothetical protein